MEQVGLEVKLTGACNQRCTHCVNSDSPDSADLLDVPLLTRRIAEFAAGAHRDVFLKGVRITGGEPLLFPEEVKAIAAECRRHGITCGINTNAVMLSETLARELKASGIDLLKISLDSTDDEVLRRFRGTTALVSTVLRAIEGAQRAGMRIILRFTLTRITADQLIPCYELADRLGADLFQVKPLVASGRAVHSGLFLDAALIHQCLERLRPVAESGKTRALVLCWPSAFSGGLSSQPCGSADKLYVDTALDVSICNYVSNAMPLGNLMHASLHELFTKRADRLDRTAAGAPVGKGCPQLAFFNAV